MAEVTLVLLLFADAARVDLGDLRQHSGLPVRLLAIGLPLTFALGTGFAAALVTDLPWELAALVGAVLAPTDAALSASVVSDDSLPESIRRSLNVESGLNDGIATPAVTAFVATSATLLGVGFIDETASSPGIAAFVDLAGGLAIGAVGGYVGGLGLPAPDRRDGSRRGTPRRRPDGRRAHVPRRGAARRQLLRGRVRRRPRLPSGHRRRQRGGDRLPEVLGRVLSLVVWFVFGADLLLDGLEHVDWRVRGCTPCSA